jgi:HlyD family secretion protein
VNYYSHWSFTMTTRFRLFALAAVLVVIAVSVYVYLHNQNGRAAGVIRLSGNIEATDIQVAFKIPGRVEKRFFDEGQFVHAGDVVASLDTADLRATVAMRQAEVQTAKAALAELLAGSRPQEIESAEAAMERAAHGLADLEAGSRPQEIATAQAAVTVAKADLERLQLDLGRMTALYQRKTVSTEQYDAARTSHDVALGKYQQAIEQLKLIQEGPRKEQIAQARFALAQAKAQCELVKIGPRDEEKEKARSRLAQAEAALKLAETQLGYTTVRSSLTGVVLSKNIEPGEYVAPGTPVVTVGDLVHVWLRGYIPEDQLGRVKVGQRAIITTDTFPGKEYEGRVAFISSESEFTPKNVQTPKERVKLVYRIKIDITNPNMELKLGMPADAEIFEKDDGRKGKDNGAQTQPTSHKADGSP